TAVTSPPSLRVTVSSQAPATPVATGPTRSARAAACPLVAQGFVHRTLGERLGRITVQRAGDRVVGCRFFALQHGPLHRSERLPGPHQPVLEITTTRWPTATDAYNAFVRRSELGTNATRAALGGSHAGVCFQNDFYPPDHGQDYACTTSKATVELLVRSVDTTGTFNTIAVTRKVLDALTP
ncbi:hypothetical protein, partial [Jatrophihabitans endophyticus]|uniref:hypothetical protein n=1 Tax=Jatrophihabitans endophyticus TaxID=1206085 RepID=UPI0019DB7A3E